MGHIINIFEWAAAIVAAKEKADTLDKLGEVTSEIVASDKVGFNARVFYLDGKEIKREYIADPAAQGTSAETAIPFVDGMSIKPNTYYTYDGKVYVYMGEATEGASWDEVSEKMAEW